MTAGKVVVKMERGRIVLEMPTTVADLEVNGALQAQYFMGAPEGPECLRAELRKSSAACSAVSMMGGILKALEKPPQSGQGKSEAVRRASAAAGLMAGLRGEYRIVGGTVMAPDHNGDVRCFVDGWLTGQGIYRAIAIAETGEDPRDQWGAA